MIVGGQTDRDQTLTFWRSKGPNGWRPSADILETFSARALALHRLGEPVTFAGENHNMGVMD